MRTISNRRQMENCTAGTALDGVRAERRRRKSHFAWVLAAFVALLGTSAPSHAQVCSNPTWTSDAWAQHWNGTSGAVNLADTVFAYGLNQPGVTVYYPASCPIISGSESAGTAAYTCTIQFLCQAPACSVQQTGSSWIGVQEICPLAFFAYARPLECSSCNSVPDPINPATAGMFNVEMDVSLAGPSPIVFKRYYNSESTAAEDMGPGWTHSYSRSILQVNTAAPYLPYPNSPLASGLYGDPGTACTSGFATISPNVPAWSSASVVYTNGACVVSNSSGTAIGTLEIYADSNALPPVSSSPEIDAARDDGQVLRYTFQNGVINPQPGNTTVLATTSSGYTLTDGNDTVETYNSVGKLQSITTRTGVVQTMGYDGSGRLSTIIDSFGHSLTLNYDSLNRLSTVGDPNGHTVQYGYDSSSRLSTVTNLDGTSKTYLYQNASFPAALTGENDETGALYSSWGYDSSGRANSTQEAGGANLTSLNYVSASSVTITDGLGAQRTFTYTRVGDTNQPTSISGSKCATCTESAATTYDLAGYVSSRTDYNGNLTCYSNDPVRGLELVRVEGFAPGSTCPSNLSSYTPASGTVQRKITTTWHSTFHEPLSITEANRTTGFTYDGSGNMLTKTVTDLTVTPNTTRTWTNTYDSYGRILTAKLPRTDVNSTTTYQYYTCTTGFQCGQVQSVQNALSQTTTYNTYNADGLPLTITDPNGVVTTLSYDFRHRVTSRQVGAETTGLSYYSTGLLETVTLPDASTVTYTYDGAHRLTKIADGLGNNIQYPLLDALGNRTAESAYDPSNVLSRTHTRAFNTLSQLYQDIGAAGTSGVTTTYGYDANGNQTSIAAPLSRTTGNQFDALNRLRQITDPGSGITLIAYDTNDNVLTVTDPRSIVSTYTYNGFGDTASASLADVGIAVSTYAYDSGGNLGIYIYYRGIF